VLFPTLGSPTIPQFRGIFGWSFESDPARVTRLDPAS